MNENISISAVVHVEDRVMGGVQQIHINDPRIHSIVQLQVAVGRMIRHMDHQADWQGRFSVHHIEFSGVIA